MLDAIRKRSRSLVVKILLGLLVISFATWGIGDMLRTSGGDGTAVQVGDIEISANQLSFHVNRELNQLRQMTGGRIDAQQAKAMGLTQQVVGNVVTRALYDAEARRLGVLIGENEVAAEVWRTQDFKGIDGRFDRTAFMSALINAGLSESVYLDMVRGDMLRRPVTGTVMRGINVPEGVFAPLYAHRSERRGIEKLLIAAEEQADDPAPEQAELQAFYQERQRAFMSPDYRALTVAWVSPKDLAGEVAVDEQDLIEAYEARKHEFGTPERRSIAQMMFDKEVDAQLAHERLVRGDDFDEVARETTGGDPIVLEDLTFEAMPRELGNAAFQIPRGGFSIPLESPLGWHVLRVVGIDRGTSLPFEEAKEQIREGLSLEHATDALYQLANRIEDELAAGSAIEEMARALNLRLTRIDAVDRTGLTPGGDPVGGVPFAPNFLDIAFATAEGSVSSLSDAGAEGIFVLRVDGVTPAATRPLDEVHDKVVAAWQAERRAEKAKALAEAMMARIQAGETLAAIAAETGLPLETPGALARAAGHNQADPLVEAVFAAAEGQVVMVADPEGFVLARVTDVTIAEPTSGEAGIEGMRAQIADSIRNDLLFQFARALERTHTVTINRAVVDSLL